MEKSETGSVPEQPETVTGSVPEQPAEIDAVPEQSDAEFVPGESAAEFVPQTQAGIEIGQTRTETPAGISLAIEVHLDFRLRDQAIECYRIAVQLMPGSAEMCGRLCPRMSKLLCKRSSTRRNSRHATKSMSLTINLRHLEERGIRLKGEFEMATQL